MEATRSFFPGASAPHRDKNISTFQNAVGVTESAADGCLATTKAFGAQPPERFGKKEKVAFSMRFWARYVNDPLDRLFSLRVSGARAQKKHTLDERANEKLNLL